MFTTLMVLRRKQGLTQTELASSVGLTQGEVSLAESGKRVRRLDLLALYFDVKDPDDLLIDWDTYREKELVAV
jgi:transcriptional regulator with XRE-family HTH domain